MTERTDAPLSELERLLRRTLDTPNVVFHDSVLEHEIRDALKAATPNTASEGFAALFERTLTPEAIQERMDAERWRWIRGKVAFHAGLHITRNTEGSIEFLTEEYADKAVDESRQRYERPQSAGGEQR